MNDVDVLLGRLRDAPAPPRLTAMDDAVLASLRSDSRGPSARMISAGALAALVLGVAATALPNQPVRAAANPFGAASALAPSTLLGVAGD